MSQINIRNLSNENDDGSPEIVGVSTFSATSFFVPPKGTTAERPTDCEPGSIRFNTDTSNLEYFRGNTIGWSQFELVTGNLGGGTGSNTGLGARGLYKTGQRAPSSGSYSAAIDFLTISTLGNAQDFGDVSTNRSNNGALSSRTRGIIGAGYGPSNQIEFVTIASTGDATDFGDDVGNSNGQVGLSDGTRGIFAGSTEVSPGNVIRYITIAATGNAVDFGDLNYAASNMASAASSTRGLIAGGGTGGNEYNNIDFITISSTGNATDFGDLSYTSTSQAAGGSNSTRAIFYGGNDTPGYSNVNTICFNTIATTGNSVDFGDTTVTTSGGSTCPDATRCVMKLGNSGNGSTGFANIIEFVQFATTGNSTDFGDSVLSTLSCHRGTISSAHGGL